MNIDKLRERFAEFMRYNKLETVLQQDHSLTVEQDSTLKYERIDKYRVLMLTWVELRDLMNFCGKNEIDMWFGADKLCIGYSHRSNMRLSAYYSVLPGRPAAVNQEDINYDELEAAPSAASPPISGVEL